MSLTGHRPAVEPTAFSRATGHRQARARGRQPGRSRRTPAAGRQRGDDSVVSDAADAARGFRRVGSLRPWREGGGPYVLFIVKTLELECSMHWRR